jgi:hypothetical protein
MPSLPGAWHTCQAVLHEPTSGHPTGLGDARGQRPRAHGCRAPVEPVFGPSVCGASLASGTVHGRWSARVRGRGHLRTGQRRGGQGTGCRSGGQTACPVPGATHRCGGALRNHQRPSRAAPQRPRPAGLCSPHAVAPSACEEAGGAGGAWRVASASRPLTASVGRHNGHS